MWRVCGWLSLLWAGHGLAAAPAILDLSQISATRLTMAKYQRLPVEAELNQAMEGEWRPYDSTHLNQGITDRAHWLHFKVHNPTQSPIQWVIRGETSYLDNLVVYYGASEDAAEVSDYRRTHLSDRQGFHSRPLDYRTLSVPLVTAAGQTADVYLKAYYDQPETLSLAFTLHSLDDFERLQNRENLVLGLFYGALGIMLLLSLMATARFRRANILYYALFLAVSLLFWLMFNGYGYQYLWPRATYWHNEGFHLVFLAFAVAALHFSRSLLDLARLAPFLNRLFQAVQVVGLVGVLLRLAGFYHEVLLLSYALLGAVAILVPLASFLVWRRGLGYAFWCLLAWLVYSAGLLVSLVSASTNLLPWGMWSLGWLQAATLLETLCLMVAMTAWVVDLEGERKKAVTLAHQDPLTGLGNRRLLQSAYRRYREAFGQSSQSLFIVVIDLDHFKRVNDRYGHDAGDAVLKDFARLLRTHCRKQDVAVRFGGEEFALLLPLDDLDAARRVAERIRVQFDNNPTHYEGQMIEHTLSCGVAEVLSPRVYLDVNAMMRCADEALFKAKRAGRNTSYTCSLQESMMLFAESTSESRLTP